MRVLCARSRASRAYLRARIMRALAGLCVRLGVCLRVRVRARPCAGLWGRVVQFESESSPRLSSSFLGRCWPFCVAIQRITRLDSPMVQGHGFHKPSGAVRGYDGVLTFDRQDHDRRSWRTRTARQRRQEEQDYRSNQDYDAGSLEHGAHSVRSFG